MGLPGLYISNTMISSRRAQVSLANRVRERAAIALPPEDNVSQNNAWGRSVKAHVMIFAAAARTKWLLGLRIEIRTARNVLVELLVEVVDGECT